MARHSAGHGVDGKNHLHAAGRQRRGEFGDCVLALCDGEPVSGDNDHPLRIAELDCDVLGRGGDAPAGRSARLIPPSSRPGRRRT